MIGMTVSGSAVPTAARMLPTALWCIFSRWPSSSIPLVNRMLDSRIMNRLASHNSTSANTGRPPSSGLSRRAVVRWAAGVQT